MTKKNSRDEKSAKMNKEDKVENIIEHSEGKLLFDAFL